MPKEDVLQGLNGDLLGHPLLCAGMRLSLRTEAGKIASRAGGSLSFDSTPAPIESGFILSYGGIEENCSLRSIFTANKDQIQDTAMKVLFS